MEANPTLRHGNPAKRLSQQARRGSSDNNAISRRINLRILGV